MKTLRLALVVFCYFAIQGCATITKGKTDTVHVQVSNCSESISCTAANKKGSWQFSAPGPVTFTKSDNDLVLSCQDGPGVVTQRLMPTRGSMAWGNVLVGGIIGGGVDAKTDAHWDIVDSVTIHRQYCFGNPTNPQQQSSTQQPTEIQPARTVTSAAPSVSRGASTQSVSLSASAGSANLPVSANSCHVPETPRAIPEDPDQSELLRAKRQLELFQDLNLNYQSCLAKIVNSQPLTTDHRQALLSAHNMSVTIEEALVQEFNSAYDTWEAKK